MFASPSEIVIFSRRTFILSKSFKILLKKLEMHDTHLHLTLLFVVTIFGSGFCQPIFGNRVWCQAFCDDYVPDSSIDALDLIYDYFTNPCFECPASSRRGSTAAPPNLAAFVPAAAPAAATAAAPVNPTLMSASPSLVNIMLEPVKDGLHLSVMSGGMSWLIPGVLQSAGSTAAYSSPVASDPTVAGSRPAVSNPAMPVSAPAPAAPPPAAAGTPEPVASVPAAQAPAASTPVAPAPAAAAPTPTTADATTVAPADASTAAAAEGTTAAPGATTIAPAATTAAAAATTAAAG